MCWWQDRHPRPVSVCSCKIPTFFFGHCSCFTAHRTSCGGLGERHVWSETWVPRMGLMSDPLLFFLRSAVTLAFLSGTGRGAEGRSRCLRLRFREWGPVPAAGRAPCPTPHGFCTQSSGHMEGPRFRLGNPQACEYRGRGFLNRCGLATKKGKGWSSFLSHLVPVFPVKRDG